MARGDDTVLSGEGAREVGDLTGRAFCCPICDTDRPDWEITRQGDVAVSWACNADVARVMDLMQRDHEVTRLMVRLSPKVREPMAKVNRGQG